MSRSIYRFVFQDITSETDTFTYFIFIYFIFINIPLSFFIAVITGVGMVTPDPRFLMWATQSTCNR